MIWLAPLQPTKYACVIYRGDAIIIEPHCQRKMAQLRIKMSPAILVAALL